jgi:hypothetical protein
MLAKKTVKNQISLPKAIVEKLPATDYFEAVFAVRRSCLDRWSLKPRGHDSKKSGPR